MAEQAPNRRSQKALERKRKERRRNTMLVGIPLVIALGTIGVVFAKTQSGSSDPVGVRSFDVGSQPKHVAESVNYEQMPPAGGDHAGTWQNCGFYSQPIMNEQGVHSLEHGAVWITYSPTLADDQKQAVREAARRSEYILASPMDGLPSPVVATAWGKQQQFAAGSDPGIAAFITKYANGPQALEPGAPCWSGQGVPG